MDKLFVRVIRLGFIPELVNFLGPSVLNDVMKCHQAAAAHEWRIHFKIQSYTLIPVVAIDKEEVQLMLLQDSLNEFQGFGIMGILA